MLKDIRDCDESQYPVNTSNPPKGSSDGQAKNTSYYDKKSYDQCGYGSYPAWAMNIWEEQDNYQSDSLSDVESEKENDDVQQDKTRVKPSVGSATIAVSQVTCGMTVRSH